MLFFSEQNTNQMHQLLEDGKDYLELQKRYIGLQSAETLTKLLSAIAVWAIVILVGALVLLFACVALAFWLGSITGSIAIGFSVIAAVLLLLIIVIYANRKRWITEPASAFLVSLTAPPAPNETYAQSIEQTTAERTRVGAELAMRRNQMKQTAQTLLEPTTKAASKWESAGNLIQNGMAIFKGIQWGVSAIAAVRLMLGGKKRRRR